MIKTFINSKTGVSRLEIKELAEAGDWKAALVIGLTYEFRFVCEKEECELAIRSPFENSRPFSNRKAVQYYTIAAKHNSVEAFAALGRMLFSMGCHDQERAVKDYLLKSTSRFKSSWTLLYPMCFEEELESIEDQLEYEDDEDEIDEDDLHLLNIPGITGLMLFRLSLVSIIKHPIIALQIPELCKALACIKAHKSKPRIVCASNKIYMIYLDRPRSVENEIFIQKADDFEDEDRTVAKMDPGVMMDARISFDMKYFSRLDPVQPVYLCEHMVKSVGNACSKCSILAVRRVHSVQRNGFQFSRDESFTGAYYSVIFSMEGGEDHLDYFQNYGIFEIKAAIRVIALQPMDLHPLQLAKDPNIYWPIIYYYGSVYSALKELLDEEIVDSIYKNIPEFIDIPDRRNVDELLKRKNIVPEEKFVIKCGYCPCIHLDWKYEFKQCSKCKLRRYCSSRCQKEDWSRHKKECFLRPRARSTDEETEKSSAWVKPKKRKSKGKK